MKAYVHTAEGDYEVGAMFLRVDVKGDVVTLYGAMQLDGAGMVDPQPLATVKLSDRTFILYGDKHPAKAEVPALVC